MWKIGNIKINNQIVLAPMAGISNPAFIRIVSEMGLGLAYTELISAEAIVRNNKKTFDMLRGIETLEIPVGIQIFGSNAETLAESAKIITDLYPNAFIDINMGCPVPKVALSAQAGSALLKDPDKVFQIVSAVVAAVTVPVTVKIRSGWDHSSINAVDIAYLCEKAGAKAIAIHARTRSQGYRGTADWNIIKAVKEAVTIPVIGNGDVTSVFDAARMLEETNCDAVMIGRSALGNPWIFKQCIDYLDHGTLPTDISISEKIAMIRKHFTYLRQIKPDTLVLLEIRSHAAWYLKGIPNGNILKQKLFQVKTVEEFEQVLDQYEVMTD